MNDTETYTAYRLANMADCACPDNSESPGALFLRSIAFDYAERKEYGEVDEDTAHEIADGAPSIYTYTRWQQFVDLGAWQEDLDELGGPTNDMEQNAGVCLYLIAARLVAALAAEDEDEDEDSDDDASVTA